MISDQRLNRLTNIETCYGTTGEMLSIARELLALRKAFVQHAAWIADDGNVYSPADFDGDAEEMDLVAKAGGFEPLYRKPTLP